MRCHPFGSCACLAFALLLVCSCVPSLPDAPVPRASKARLASPASDSGTDAEGEVVVTLVSGVDPLAFGAEYGATLLRGDDQEDVVYRPGGDELPHGLAARMSLDPRAVSAEPNAWLETAESRQQAFAFDDGYGTASNFQRQRATRTVGLDAAHLASTGYGVLIAILDTGAELGHPALRHRIAGGWDFVAGDPDPTDEADGLDNDGDGRVDEARGHGSHVAGIVARTAPGADLLIVRVLDADGRGDTWSVVSGMRWALARGARVFNLSFGLLQESEAIDHAVEEADRNGAVLVASAGNWGASSPEEFPAGHSRVIAVAATDAQDGPASFTSYGSFVDLSAPGVDVRSAYVGGTYALWSGTSMAAPFVSGTAALLLSLHPDWRAEQLMGRLASTARPFDEDRTVLAEELGAGVLDAGAALEPDLPPPGSAGDLPTSLPRRP